jgi:hypothetical protein
MLKKVYEQRPDGGPTTNSKAKTANLISPHAEVVHEKLIKKTGEEIIECHTIINFIKSQKNKP